MGFDFRRLYYLDNNKANGETMQIGRSDLLTAVQNDLLRVFAWAITSLLIDVEPLPSHSRTGLDSAADRSKKHVAPILLNVELAHVSKDRDETG
jgi:hypothetical protein